MLTVITLNNNHNTKLQYVTQKIASLKIGIASRKKREKNPKSSMPQRSGLADSYNDAIALYSLHYPCQITAISAFRHHLMKLVHHVPNI